MFPSPPTAAAWPLAGTPRAAAPAPFESLTGGDGAKCPWIPRSPDRPLSQLERLSLLEAFRDRTKVLSGCDRRSVEIEIENGAKLTGSTCTYDVILYSSQR